MPREAFQAKKRTTFLFDPYDLVLVTDKSHPLYDPRVEEPPDEGLIRSILRFGVIEPPVITKNADGKPEVVDGRRRVKAARVATDISKDGGGPPILVQCVYRTGTERDLFSVVVSANEHRRDDNPVEKAEKANRMINMGACNADVAEAFGVTTQTVRNWLKLLELPPAERKAVEQKQNTMSAALSRPRTPGKPRAGTVRLRKKKEVQAALREAKEPAVMAVLEWVLGERETLG